MQFSTIIALLAASTALVSAMPQSKAINQGRDMLSKRANCSAACCQDRDNYELFVAVCTTEAVTEGAAIGDYIGQCGKTLQNDRFGTHSLMKEAY